jgi:hypothetical protein
LIREELLADDQVIYRGAMVSTLSTDGFVYEAGDTANHIFAGIALNGANTNDDADGAVAIRVLKEGVIILALDANATFVQANKGSEVTILDDATVSKAATTTNDIKCGIFLGFKDNDATSGYGEINITSYAK